MLKIQKCVGLAKKIRQFKEKTCKSMILLILAHFLQGKWEKFCLVQAKEKITNILQSQKAKEFQIIDRYLSDFGMHLQLFFRWIVDKLFSEKLATQKSVGHV